MQESKGAREQGSRRAGLQESKGAREQGSRRAGKQGNRGAKASMQALRKIDSQRL